MIKIVKTLIRYGLLFKDNINELGVTGISKVHRTSVTMSFTSKVIVITGAGSGIGEATAIHFAKLSAKLSLIDINEDNLCRVAEQCEQLSEGKVLKIVVDVSKDQDLKQAVDKTIEQYKRIDVVVNCAGVLNNVGILHLDTLNVYDSMMNVNLRSIVAMTHYTAAALIESKGCIINIGSVLAKRASVDTIFYNVSKAGVLHFTKNVALELAENGVRVNCISPGLVETNLLLNAGFSQEENDQFYKYVFGSVPLQHVIKGEEVACMVEYLASDKAKSITGSDFVIDAGYGLAINSAAKKQRRTEQMRNERH